MMTNHRFLIDLTTSREYRGRNAVGIVRTEREIGKALLATGYDLGFFHFDLVAGKLLTIPRSEAAAILGETLGSDGAPIKAATTSAEVIPPAEVAEEDGLRSFLRHVQARLSHEPSVAEADTAVDWETSQELEFFNGDVLISAGLLWDGNFLEQIYVVKQRLDLRVVQVIYDIVPIIIPEFCVPGMNLKFPKYLLDTSWTADAVYCISDSTLQDVSNYLREHGLPMPTLHRICLGADLAGEGQASALLRSTLEPGNFVTYVSTIEPRKNHAMLFHVWRQLYQTDRASLVPLVIVGRHGWNSSDLINIMHGAEHLYPDYVRILTEVSDADLDWLYRNSRFTVYPSLYEGWGLPVAESLARGKFCIASDTSSLPEVACGFAELIDPLDLPAWTRRIRHYLNEPGEVLQHEAKIRSGYQSISWPTAMEDFVKSIVAVVEQIRSTPAVAGVSC